MLCEHCKQNEAVVHRIILINGSKHEQHLCAACAKEGGTVTFKLPSFAELMNVSFKEDQKGATCACGMTLDRFRESGLLGCPACYRTFAEDLLSVIKRAQGGRLAHTGAHPHANPNPAKEGVSELFTLKQALQEAVSHEEYEQAAALRDRIKAFESEEA
ncbi:MAG: UvrB/UvrC motif-containing protein [Christensenellaceae bacterium]|jgi:protein arginine kinase activator|nr:UvrB/UvrC motif-containing protein [Christensenellaceae bacterium]